jgi:hypothetical protein
MLSHHVIYHPDHIFELSLNLLVAWSSSHVIYQQLTVALTATNPMHHDKYVGYLGYQPSF